MLQVYAHRGRNALSAIDIAVPDLRALHQRHPATSPQTPENMAATIYEALGIPRTMQWHDPASRPHHVYHGEPIAGLTA